MSDSALTLAVALGVGLLLGVERERLKGDRARRGPELRVRGKAAHRRRLRGARGGVARGPVAHRGRSLASRVGAPPDQSAQISAVESAVILTTSRGSTSTE